MIVKVKVKLGEGEAAKCAARTNLATQVQMPSPEGGNFCVRGKDIVTPHSPALCEYDQADCPPWL